MSVLIKGMKMPTNCCQCPVNMEVCKRGYKYLLKHPELYDKRADDCPLIELPPHGRLIDADAVLRKDRQIYRGDMAVGYAPYVHIDEIETAPTIIEAEVE